MKPLTTAVFGFLVSLLAYTLLGIIWLIYDLQFSLAGIPASSYQVIVTTKIWEVGVFAVVGAALTAFVIYQLEIPRKPRRTVLGDFS